MYPKAPRALAAAITLLLAAAISSDSAAANSSGGLSFESQQRLSDKGFVPKSSAIKNATTKNATTKNARLSAGTQYFKPVDPSAPRSPSTTTGTRTGSCFDSDISPNLMAPSSFVGETASSLPTLTWFLPDAPSVPVELNLYMLQPSGELDLYHSRSLNYASGLSQYTLPAEAPLAENQGYLWQVVLHCNPNRPSQALVYEAELEFVPSAARMESAPVGDAVTQARVLAENGYWYDAIAVLGTSERPDIAIVRSALLRDLALLEDEMSKPSEDHTTNSTVEDYSTENYLTEDNSTEGDSTDDSTTEE